MGTPRMNPSDWGACLGQSRSGLQPGALYSSQSLSTAGTPGTEMLKPPWGSADFSIHKESHIVFPGSRKMHP